VAGQFNYGCTQHSFMVYKMIYKNYYKNELLKLARGL